MSARHNHDTRSIIIEDEAIKYKLIGGVFKRPHSSTFRQRYRINGDSVREISLETRDKAEAGRLQRQLVEEKIIAARTTAVEVDKSSTISEALATYEKYKRRAERLSTKHVDLIIGRLERTFKGASITRLNEIDEMPVRMWIGTQRQKGRMGDRTAHHYACAARAFTRWLRRKAKLLTTDPLDGLSVKGRGEIETTFERREFSQKEWSRLIRNARNSKAVFYRLDSEARVWIYRCAKVTGYRCQELASISPSSCRLDGDKPYIEVACTISKRRKRDRQPITKKFAAEFRIYLKGKPRTKPIWPSHWWANAARMLRLDMEGIEYKTEKGVSHIPLNTSYLHHDHGTSRGAARYQHTRGHGNLPPVKRDLALDLRAQLRRI